MKIGEATETLGVLKAGAIAKMAAIFEEVRTWGPEVSALGQYGNSECECCRARTVCYFSFP